MTVIIIILTAILIDAAAGDPSGAFHPAAWLRRWAGLLLDRRPTGKIRQVLFGIMVCLSGLIFTLPLRLIGFLPEAAFIAVSAILLKLSFSLAELFRSAGKIRTMLEEGNLRDARREASRSLLRRDTSDLTEFELAAAVIEALSSCISTRFTAPLFYYLIFGLPGAWTFRWINICGSMPEDRRGSPRRELKISEGADAILNWIPAVITSLFMLLPGAGGKRSVTTIASARKDPRDYTEPKADRTAAAAAVLLDVRLEKNRNTAINIDARPAEPADIGRCIKMCRRAVILMISVVITAGILAYVV